MGVTPSQIGKSKIDSTPHHMSPAQFYPRGHQHPFSFPRKLIAYWAAVVLGNRNREVP
jgi:hypothetical protein